MPVEGVRTAMSSSTRARDAAERGRSSGSLASIRITSASSSGSTSIGSGGTGVFTCATAMSTAVGPVNGRFPASASYATMPSE